MEKSKFSVFFLFNHQMPVGKKAMAAKRLDQNPQCDTSSWTPAPFWVPSPDRTKWLQAEKVPSGFQDVGGLVGGVKGTVTRTKVIFNPKDIIWVSLTIGEPQNECCFLLDSLQRTIQKKKKRSPSTAQRKPRPWWRSRSAAPRRSTRHAAARAGSSRPRPGPRNGEPGGAVPAARGAGGGGEPEGFPKNGRPKNLEPKNAGTQRKAETERWESQKKGGPRTGRRPQKNGGEPKINPKVAKPNGIAGCP